MGNDKIASQAPHCDARPASAVNRAANTETDDYLAPTDAPDQ
jgi:hypothetical protein